MLKYATKFPYSSTAGISLHCLKLCRGVVAVCCAWERIPYIRCHCGLGNVWVLRNTFGNDDLYEEEDMQCKSSSWYHRCTHLILYRTLPSGAIRTNTFGRRMSCRFASLSFWKNRSGIHIFFGSTRTRYFTFPVPSNRYCFKRQLDSWNGMKRKAAALTSHVVEFQSLVLPLFAKGQLHGVILQYYETFFSGGVPRIGPSSSRHAPLFGGKSDIFTLTLSMSIQGQFSWYTSSNEKSPRPIAEIWSRPDSPWRHRRFPWFLAGRSWSLWPLGLLGTKGKSLDWLVPRNSWYHH